MPASTLDPEAEQEQAPSSEEAVTSEARVMRVVRCVKAPAPFQSYEIEFEAIDETAAEDGHSAATATSRLAVATSECGVQTGSELLHDILIGLRKRKVSTSTFKSEASQCDDTTNGSRHTSTSTATPVSAPAHLGMSEYRAHRTSPLKQYYVNAASPLGSDHSPLLRSNVDRCPYDSTSEETLNDVSEASHDLDVLLKDISPTTGSLNSLLNSNLNLTSDSLASARTAVSAPVTERGRRQSASASAHTQQHPTTQYFGRSAATPAAIVVQRDPSRKRASLSSVPPRIPPVQIGVISRGVGAIPRIRVEEASRSSSEVSADSGRPSDWACDSRRPSQRSARAERTSAEISSIEDLSICVSDLSVATDSPVFVANDAQPAAKPTSSGATSDDVTEFKEFLRSKGLQLDLTSVQSSAV